MLSFFKHRSSSKGYMNISVIGPENLPVAILLRFGISEKRKILFKLNVRIAFSEIFKIGSGDIFRPMADIINRGRGEGGSLLLQPP